MLQILAMVWWHGPSFEHNGLFLQANYLFSSVDHSYSVKDILILVGMVHIQVAKYCAST